MFTWLSYPLQVVWDLTVAPPIGAQPSGTEVQKVERPIAAFEFAIARYSAHVRSRMPHVNLDAHAVTFASHFARPVRMLSLGAGTGDSELAVARRASLSMEITLHAVVEDANAILIPQLHNDLIVRRRSLHHIVELEHILAQIKSGLSPEGEFLVMSEVIGRNRLMLYPETEQVAQAICLPPLGFGSTTTLSRWMRSSPTPITRRGRSRRLVARAFSRS